jgi:hypothetical protein
MKNNLTARIERLEQHADPKPEIIIICLNDGESEEEARQRAITEYGVKSSFRAFVFCNEIDAAL